nr:MAG TPA: hypothetical protein [Caudoviricetes sp.]
MITLYLENLILRIDPPDSKRYTSLCMHQYKRGGLKEGV